MSESKDQQGSTTLLDDVDHHLSYLKLAFIAEQ
jgi:hypothetical protein